MSSRVRAETDTVAFRIPRDAFCKLIDENHLVAYKLLHQMAILLATRQRGTTARLSELLGATDLADVHDGIKGIVGESSVRE